MKPAKHVSIIIAFAGALLLGSGTAQAQQAPVAEGGLIGRHFAGFDLTYDHYSSAAIGYTFGVAATLNQPINEKIDVSFGYDLAGNNDSVHGLNHNALHGTVLTYQHTEYGNAYFAGTLGQSWDRVKTSGVLSRKDDAYWALSTGYEVPINATTAINAGLTYRAPFPGNSKTLQYRLEANHWFSSELAGVVSISYNQISHSPDTMLYTAGLRWAL